jgi:hypothetical protein
MADGKTRTLNYSDPIETKDGPDGLQQAFDAIEVTVDELQSAH